MHARDQSFIFSIGGKFRPDYGLLLELHVHALTLVARCYALLHPEAGLAGKESTLKHIPPSVILTVTPLGPFSSPKLTTCETKHTQIRDPRCDC